MFFVHNLQLQPLSWYVLVVSTILGFHLNSDYDAFCTLKQG